MLERGARAAGEGNPTVAPLNYEAVDQICKYNEIGSIKTICKSVYMYLYLVYICVCQCLKAR